MKLNIYSVKDVVVGELGNPFYLSNDEEAKRAYKNAINANNGTNICINYQDTQLFKLGTFDTTTGNIDSKVEYLVNGIEMKQGE